MKRRKTYNKYAEIRKDKNEVKPNPEILQKALAISRFLHEKQQEYTFNESRKDNKNEDKEDE